MAVRTAAALVWRAERAAGEAARRLLLVVGARLSGHVGQDSLDRQGQDGQVHPGVAGR